MRKLCLGSLLLPLAIALPLAHAQASSAALASTTDTTAPVYDVMTVKLNKSGSGSMGIDAEAARFSAHNVSLKDLLGTAYGIREELIFGVPASIDSARFDVEAKIVDPDPVAIGKLDPEQRHLMLLPLLIQRFQLQTHTEIRTLPVYELVIAKGGPKLQLSADQTKRGNGSTSISNNRKLVGRDLNMERLAGSLSGQVHRTVIDKTGLTGIYDLTLLWSHDDDAASDNAPSIFTAVEEQLGLKLQPAKGPVETLVVDHVEMPSEN
jgi:uncharacterized protein (TIGR03435 family)